ncbi:MAG TPA: NAD(P)-dependent oxidoreductase [Pyrinomonadaceae bacterium]|nr:NAD(P)-dependent oxidoreductase [Pyrinomonadaceae bacterium]
MPAETITAPLPQPKLRNEYVQSLTDKTILITGAGGYLGTALLASLYSIRCHIVALVHEREFLPAPAETEATVTSRYGDLSATSFWRHLLHETQPDVIVNLAAYEHYRNSQHAPERDLAINAAAVLELLDACKELQLKPRIVQASSANLFGCPTSPRVNEETPDQLLSLYSINKHTAEKYIGHYAENFDIPAAALRFANIYGPLPARDADLESRVVLNGIMRRALAGGPLYLYRNQACVRDFVYVEDAVRAICAVAASEGITPGAKYVVGSGEGYTLREIVNEIAQQVERFDRPPVEVLVDTEAELAPIEWREFIADYSRLRSTTGWEPQIKLQTGIDMTLRAFIGGQPE